MSNKWGTRLAVLTAAAAVTGAGLLSAGAGAAMATTSPGTTGPGDWSFGTFLNSEGQLVYHEGITHTSSPPIVSYSANVQQPINAPGQIPQSVFSNKTRTIPVKYVVQKCTTPGASADHYPGLLQSVADPNVVTGANSDVGASNLNWSPPSGSGLTVSQVTNLTANFQWAQGQNQAGSMRWTINTPLGNVDVYYGEPFNTGAGTVDSGVNMITDANSPAPNPARVDAWPSHNNAYDTWNNTVMSNPTVANEPVNWIGLIVDSGSVSAPEAVQLSATNPAVDIGTSVTSDATYTPGNVSSGGGSTTCAADTTDNFWLSISKTSGATPAGTIDEALIDNTQGDSGGQFRQVDGMYMYNLPMSQLTDLTATYTIGISPHSDGSNPVGQVSFGLK
jgi:hypothetical protein